MLLGVAGQHQGQSAVTSHVAGGAEAVLQGEDSQHQSGTGVVEHQDTGDQTQRSHDSAAGHAGCADSEDAEQQAEQDHGANAGQLAVQNLGNGHAEEHLSQHRAAQVDVCKQGDAEADHVLTQDLALAGALQRHTQRSCTGHGTDSGQVSGAVVTQHFPGILAGVSTGQQVQHSQPDVVTDHNDDDDLQKGGQLMGDGALVAQAAEGGGNVEGQNGDDDLAHNVQHDVLELGQKVAGQLAVGPGSSQTHQNAQHQSAHDAHDLGNVQLKDDARQLAQTGNVVVDGQVGDQAVAGAHAHEGCADRGHIGDDDGHCQQTGGVFAQLCNGRGNEADDDQRHTEGDELTHDVLQGHHNAHGALVEHLTKDDTDKNAQQKPEGQTIE